MLNSLNLEQISYTEFNLILDRIAYMEIPNKLLTKIVEGGNYLMIFYRNCPRWRLPNQLWMKIVLGKNSFC